MNTFFFIKLDSRYIRIDYDEIILIEGAKNYSRIITPNRFYLVSISMKNISEFLPKPQFIRIHKSFIINLKKVDEFNQHSAWLGDRNIPIGDQYRNNLLQSIQTPKDEEQNSFLGNLILHAQESSKAFA